MYEVQWCLTGKDPDSKPFLFSTWGEAKEFLRSELYWVSGDSDLNREDSTILMDFLMNIHELKQGDVSIVVGGIAYWILESKVPTDIYAV